MNKHTLKDLVIILFSTLTLTFLVWLPHLLALPNFYGLNFSEGFNTIYRNYDGIEYVTIAKTWYFPESLKSVPQFLPHEYYAAHFPGYSVLIALFAPIFGFLKSMLFVSVSFTILSAFAFYFLVKDFKLTNHPLSLALLFLVLPARWLIVHTVGSSEPMFIFLVISSIYFFMKYELHNKWRWIYLSALFAMFAQFTRPPGILLGIAFALYVLFKIYKPLFVISSGSERSHNYNLEIPHFIRNDNVVKRFFKAIVSYHPLFLILVALLSVFYWYSIAFKDFFAYFHSGDNIHLVFPPFQIFNVNQYWVGEFWLEDVLYVFILGFLGVIYLFKQKLAPMAFFVLVYLVATIFVAHRDISRYVLPIFPFLLIAFEKVLTSKEFKIVMAIVLLAIYLYSQNFILNNVAPYPNLEAFN